MNSYKLFIYKSYFIYMYKQGKKSWIEVYHQTFGGWEVQTMWNLRKNVWCVQRSMF